MHEKTQTRPKIGLENLQDDAKPKIQKSISAFVGFFQMKTSSNSNSG